MAKQRPNKQVLWDKALAATDRIVDGLSLHVDEGIKETVAALLVNGFKTTASCEGHLNRALPYPWVDISVPAPDNWREDPGQKQKWEKANLEQYKKMLALLSEFYQDRRVAFDVMLIPQSANFARFRLESVGAHATKWMSRKEKQEKYVLYNKEMRDFTEFLKKKYFES